MKLLHGTLTTLSTVTLLACGTAVSVSHSRAAGGEASGLVTTATAAGKLELLTPDNCALVLIDHQPQMAFGVQSIDRQLLKNNTVALARSAKAHGVPTILTAVASKTFSGPIWPEIQAAFPDQEPIERTSMNSWDNAAFRAAIEATGRKKIVIAALWTEVCLTMPTLEMLAEGYEIYFVEDACGGTSQAAHDMAIQRITQAGAVPMTWQQTLLEWQRDWARQETYAATTGIAREFGGAYGMGIDYAKAMFGGHEGK